MACADAEINTVYWRNLFVPLVISSLAIATVLVMTTVNPGEPHKLLTKSAMKGGFFPKSIVRLR
jgi:hypothetical protein